MSTSGAWRIYGGDTAVEIAFIEDANCLGVGSVAAWHRTDAHVESDGLVNKIFESTLGADPGAADLITLRELAEVEVTNRLLAVPCVKAATRLGSYLNGNSFTT